MIELICKNCGNIFKVDPYRKSSAKYCCHPCYLASKPPMVEKICLCCKKPFKVQNFRKNQALYCSRKCQNKTQNSRTGEKALRWKGGKRGNGLRSDGTQYIYIYNPNHPRATKNKTVPEQVLIAEKALGRFLNKKEICHHINEIKSDNRLENLYLFSTDSAHRSYHNKLRYGKCKKIDKSNLIP